MNIIRPVVLLALAGLASSCGSTAPPTTSPPTETRGLDVSIASVTLADDCGTGPTQAPAAAPADDASAHVGDREMSGVSMSQAKRACEQSSIQLRIANGTADASHVAIQRVELIDAAGDVVAELISREPSQWADDMYQAWDEQVAPSAVLQVSYALSAADVTRSGSYTVRVTVAAGGDARTLEQRTTIEAEASMPPDAVT